jgi:serine/threonine-protein kinase
VQTDWGEFSFDSYFDAGGRRLNPYENVLNVNNVGRLGVDWRFPTRADVGSSPAVVNGVVYVGSGDKNVYALNARTGAKLWSYATGDGVYTSPAVAKEVVYVGSLDQNVYALNARTGAKLWSYNLGYRVYSYNFGYIAGSFAVAKGVVYGTAGFSIYALNARTGTLLWSYDIHINVSSSAAVANGVVYLAGYALNARTGTLLWRYDTGNGSPAVANGVVYVSSLEGNVDALDANTGALLWTYTTDAAVYSSPSVANGVVYVGSGHKVYAFGVTRRAEQGGEDSKHPELKTLRPDFKLKVSQPVATPTGAEL